jgi:hypothetical protein
MATTKTNGGVAPKAVGEGVRALQSDTRELLGALEQLTASAGEALREQMDQRPYVAIGAGFLAGYVLGGGLSLRLATFLAAGAARVTAAQLVARGLAGATATRAGGRAS